MDCTEHGSRRLETLQVPHVSFLLLTSCSSSGVPLELKVCSDNATHGWLQLIRLTQEQKEQIHMSVCLESLPVISLEHHGEFVACDSLYSHSTPMTGIANQSQHLFLLCLSVTSKLFSTQHSRLLSPINQVLSLRMRSLCSSWFVPVKPNSLSLVP